MFRSFQAFACPLNFLYKKFKMALFKYGFNRKYGGFVKVFLPKSACTTCHKTFLPWNFRGSKLTSHTHTHVYNICVTCMYTHIHAHIVTYTHCIHTYTCMHTYTHMYTHAHIHTCTHTYTHLYACAHTLSGYVCKHAYNIKDFTQITVPTQNLWL